MTEKLFVFFFYELTSPWAPTTIRRSLRVENDDSGRYDQYFIALWFELPTVEFVDECLEDMQRLEQGTENEVNIGATAWIIDITLDQVIFHSNDFDDWNDGVNNVFPYAEFKTVLIAWRQFLSLPVEPAGNEYIFKLPSALESLRFEKVDLVRRNTSSP